MNRSSSFHSLAGCNSQRAPVGVVRFQFVYQAGFQPCPWVASGGGLVQTMGLTSVCLRSNFLQLFRFIPIHHYLELFKTDLQYVFQQTRKQSEQRSALGYWSCLAPVAERCQLNLCYEKQDKLPGTKLSAAVNRLCAVAEFLMSMLCRSPWYRWTLVLREVGILFLMTSLEVQEPPRNIQARKNKRKQNVSPHLCASSHSSPN